MGIEVHDQSLCPIIPPMIGTVMYYIQYVCAEAVLGYMYVLESNPPRLEDVMNMEVIYGPSLFRTARYHAENDPDHAEELLRMIEELPPETKQVVEEMMHITRAHLNAVHNLLMSLEQQDESSADAAIDPGNGSPSTDDAGESASWGRSEESPESSANDESPSAVVPDYSVTP